MRKFLLMGLVGLVTSCSHFYEVESHDSAAKVVTIKNEDKDYVLKAGEVVFVYENVCSKVRRATFCSDEPTTEAEIVEVNDGSAKLKLLGDLKTGKISFVKHPWESEAPSRNSKSRDRI